MEIGGVGLNIQHASVVIICEPQWNLNAERQAAGRAWRQGQEKMVKAMVLCGDNSAIDRLVLQTQHRKSAINEALMQPLIRKPGEGPADIQLLPLAGFIPNDYSLVQS